MSRLKNKIMKEKKWKLNLKTMNNNNQRKLKKNNLKIIPKVKLRKVTMKIILRKKRRKRL